MFHHHLRATADYSGHYPLASAVTVRYSPVQYSTVSRHKGQDEDDGDDGDDYDKR
jgi:hypothetical protein